MSPRVKAEQGDLSIHVRTRGEHKPPHVHVHLGKGKPHEPQVKVWLGGESEEEGKKPSLGPVKNKMTEGDAQRALELVKQHLAECWKVWREYNGHL